MVFSLNTCNRSIEFESIEMRVKSASALLHLQSNWLPPICRENQPPHGFLNDASPWKSMKISVIC